MSSDIQVLTATPVPTAVVREKVAPSDLSRFVPAACGEVWNFLRAAGIAGAGRHVALYLNPGGEVEVGAEVPAAFAGTERVRSSALPGGLVATTTHFGPYSGLGRAHAEVRRWCSEQGFRTTGTCWEVYGHWDKSWNSDPSRIRTDIFHALEPDSSTG